METWCTYVLFLEESKIYVGCINQQDIDKRIEKHCNGNGASWTRKYKPLKNLRPIVFYNLPTREESLEKENLLTVKYMKAYGIENVRGHVYSEVELPDEKLLQIRDIMIHDDNRCFKCSQKGHYVLNCPESLPKGNPNY